MKLLVSIDDGCQSDLKIARLCLKLGIEAIFYIPVDYLALAMVKGYEPLSPQAFNYLNDNFLIGSHGITHAYLTRISRHEAMDEIHESKQMMENLTGQKITKFCYPRGYYDDEIKQMVKDAGYESARTTAIGHFGEQVDPFESKTAVHIGCPIRPEYEGTTWVQYGQELASKAGEDDVFEVWGHSWELDKYNEWGNVEKFLKGLVNGKS